MVAMAKRKYVDEKQLPCEKTVSSVLQHEVIVVMILLQMLLKR